MSNTTGYSLRQHQAPFRASVIGRAIASLSQRIHQLKTVNELEQLSDRQLRDIGVDRREIEQIAEREFAKLRTR